MNNVIHIDAYLKNRKKIKINDKENKILEIVINKEINDVKFILKTTNNHFYWRKTYMALKTIKNKLAKKRYVFDDFEIDVLFGSIEQCLSINSLAIVEIYKEIDFNDIEILHKFYLKHLKLLQNNPILQKAKER